MHASVSHLAEVHVSTCSYTFVPSVPFRQIPLSSANGQLDEMIRHKRRIVLLNKSDLANTNLEQVRLSHDENLQTDEVKTMIDAYLR